VASHRELRRFSRKPLEVEIQAGDNTIGGKLLFDSRNVSEGGVFLKSELLLEVGETLWLSFVLPGTAMAIRTRGRVVWVHRTPNDNDPTDIPGMGVQFLDLSDAEQAALQVYLSES
jgi:type IV pilus assembly protein PilZ